MNANTFVQTVNELFSKKAELRNELLEAAGESRIAPVIFERFAVSNYTSEIDANTGEEQLYAQVELPPELLRRHAALDVHVLTHDMSIGKVTLVGGAFRVPILKLMTDDIHIDTTRLMVHTGQANPVEHVAGLLKKAVAESIIRAENVAALKLLDNLALTKDLSGSNVTYVDKTVVSAAMQQLSDERVYGTTPTLLMPDIILTRSLPDASVAGDSIAAEGFTTGRVGTLWGCRVFSVRYETWKEAGLADESNSKVDVVLLGEPKYVGRFVETSPNLTVWARQARIDMIAVQSLFLTGLALLRDRVGVKITLKL